MFEYDISFQTILVKILTPRLISLPIMFHLRKVNELGIVEGLYFTRLCTLIQTKDSLRKIIIICHKTRLILNANYPRAILSQEYVHYAKFIQIRS